MDTKAIREALAADKYAGFPITRIKMQEWIQQLLDENEQLQADKAVAVEALKHIAEYWNRDQNEKAMADALWHIIETAESGIERIESGEKG